MTTKIIPQGWEDNTPSINVETKITPTQQTEAPKKVQPNFSISDIMELLAKQGDEIKWLRDKNEELNQKLDPSYEILKGREKYVWPRSYSYWVINNKPIVSWKTVSDEQYQNPYTKKWEAKQEIEVQFYDWEKKTYDITPFGQLLKRSEKQLVSEVTQKGSKTFLTFDHNGTPFEVEVTFINP